jgi:hypothetical protein
MIARAFTARPKKSQKRNHPQITPSEIEDPRTFHGAGKIHRIRE